MNHVGILEWEQSGSEGIWELGPPLSKLAKDCAKPLKKRNGRPLLSTMVVLVAGRG